MGNPQSFQAFHDPAHSLWQAAVHSTLLKHAAQGKQTLNEDARGVAKTSDHPFMSATVHAIHEVKNSTNPAPATVQGKPHPDDLRKCASLGAKLAWAAMFDRAALPKLKDEFENSVCDPFWSECYLEYEWMIARGGKQPYIPYKDIGDFVVPDCFGDKATIAVVSDWGTGMNDALVLLRQIALNFKPDVLLHLGDIYYAGLPHECDEHFVNVIAEVWPENPPLVYALSGNHDRYAGDKGGYYPMIAKLNRGNKKSGAAKLGQPNSYFCLRNNFWQLLAMDTGIHDTNPWTEYKNLPYVTEQEVTWHLDKVRGNGAGVNRAVNASGVRGTVLLSHHQLMSFIGVGREKTDDRLLAVNPHLAYAFAPVFGMVDAWLWGHEHDLCVFEPYSMGPGQPLPMGRCVGAGSIPVFPPEPEAQDELVLPDGETQPPTKIKGTELSDNGTVFFHAYAMMRLDGPAMTIDYYQVDSSGGDPKAPPALDKIPHSDVVTTPRAAGGLKRGIWAKARALFGGGKR